MYEKLRNAVFDILNCDDSAMSPRTVINRIVDLYEDGEISGTQYGCLMNYLQDMV